MPRPLRNFLLVLPAVLLLCALYTLARSYLPEHMFFGSQQGRLFIFFLVGGQSRWFDSSSEHYLGTNQSISHMRRLSFARHAPEGKFAGIEWVGMDFDPAEPCMLSIPYWYVAAPLAIASVWSVMALRRRRLRERPGHCVRCGYDLRASGDKCPECGAARAAVTAQN